MARVASALNTHTPVINNHHHSFREETVLALCALYRVPALDTRPVCGRVLHVRQRQGSERVLGLQLAAKESTIDCCLLYTITRRLPLDVASSLSSLYNVSRRAWLETKTVVLAAAAVTLCLFEMCSKKKRRPQTVKYY